MDIIKESDWNFDNIRTMCEARAVLLENAGSPDTLANALTQNLSKAIECREFRVAIDSKGNMFVERRAIVQFQVAPENYDWFFNARTGYRAQFWRGPCIGIDFNKMIVKSLSGVLSQRLPQNVQARRIKVEVANGHREEKDEGVIEVPHKEIISSLAPEASKIWIAERRYDAGVGGEGIVDIGFAVLSHAERCLPKLNVPRWVTNPATCTGEGLRAPCPEACKSWLDLKGGFLDTEGNACQIKAQDKRAKQIHRCGWT